MICALVGRLPNLEPVIFHVELISQNVHVLNWHNLGNQRLSKHILGNLPLSESRWSILIVDEVNLFLKEPSLNLNIL